MNKVIDLRSDTVTRPTPEMRRAMADAMVGDDVFGEDPTTARLQDMAAEITGKQSALFVPSGTMANNIAIHTHTRPGDEILLDWDAHSLCYELGGPAVLSGVQTRQFHSHRGVPNSREIEAAIHEQTLHSPGTSLLVLENTHNRAGGAVIPLGVHRELYEMASARGLKVHIDGARIFNASIASGVPVNHYGAQADSICFCLSKGLSCPAGSLLCGTREFIEAARRARKLLGGGMRQCGVLAACGIVALESMIDRLVEDHKNAQDLANGINGLPGIKVDMQSVQTNMVYFETDAPAAEIRDKLRTHDLLCNATSSNRIRLVTHHDVTASDVTTAISIFRRVMC